MKAHIVLAHPEPKSFNAQLAILAQQTLEKRGWTVSMSDLYAMGFDPCEKAAHYENRQQIDWLDQADLLVLQYPIWWHLPPAILKGWFDRVFVYGEVYRSEYRFNRGRFLGKKAILSLTVGTSAETYAYDGRSGDIDLLLWPVNFSLAYVGFSVLEPHIAFGVEAGLKYSDPQEIKDRLKAIQVAYVSRLQDIENEAVIAFNGLDDWGANGRIKASAPAYSPFIRHREQLEID
jgi:NAD(P)H dehydrogenase (quinone)